MWRAVCCGSGNDMWLLSCGRGLSRVALKPRECVNRYCAVTYIVVPSQHICQEKPARTSHTTFLVELRVAIDRILLRLMLEGFQKTRRPSNLEATAS